MGGQELSQNEATNFTHFINNYTLNELPFSGSSYT